LLNPDYREMLSLFGEEKVEYLLVGAYALAAHGLPRATGDMDVWINPSRANADRVWNALSRFGAPLEDVDKEELETAGMVFQIGVAPRRIDLMTSIEGVEFSDAWGKHIVVEVEGLELNVISREHLIANKKALGRAQDLVDLDRLSG
jgi:hypothetical protein